MTGSAIPVAPWALRGAVLCPPPPLPAGLCPGVRAELQRCFTALVLLDLLEEQIFKPS